MNRRDFLLGNATGLAAGAVATYLGTRSGEAPTKQAAAPVSGPPAPQPVAVNSAQVTYADQHTDKAKISYAQNGEDLILVQTLKHVLRIDKPDYIDIGAWDPVIGSNTYLLYSQGSRGVVIEPNPAFVDRLRKVRTEDKVLNIGVGLDKKDSVADYYIIEGDGQLNTFSKEQMERHKKRDPNIVKDVMKMPLRNVNDVLAENFKTAPALFSLDVEGMEFAIAKTLDFDKWRPKVFIIETALPSALVNEEIVTFMRSKGYLHRAGNLVNSVFVEAKLLG